MRIDMKTRIVNSARLILLVPLVMLLSGCSITRLKLTGTDGTRWSGYCLTDSDRVPMRWAERRLPGWYMESGMALGTSSRLKECEFRKHDTNGLLRLDVRTRGYRGVVSAPPGTTGVRVKREGGVFEAAAF